MVLAAMMSTLNIEIALAQKLLSIANLRAVRGTYCNNSMEYVLDDILTNIRIVHRKSTLENLLIQCSKGNVLNKHCLKKITS